MDDDSDKDDVSSNGEPDNDDQCSKNSGSSESTEDGRKRGSGDDGEAPEKSYFEWFQDLERKEKIAVVAGSIAILNQSGDTISDVINVADDIVSAESQSDSTTGSISISDESELSPADQYPNPDYATPKEGTTEWHIPMNNNFEKIEENIEFLSEEVVALGEMTEKNAQLMEDYVGALIGRIEQLDERVETLEGEIDNPED